MEDNIDLLDQEVEEELEETLSLSDFPMNTTEEESEKHKEEEEEELPMFTDGRPSSEFFEFFSGLTTPETNTIMSDAEDLVFCGKLNPFKENPPSEDRKPLSVVDQTHHRKLKTFQRRRSESMSELNITSTYTAAPSQLLMRSSRSLDYKKLNGSKSLSSESPPEIPRNNSGKSNVWGVKVPKPAWWCVLMSGLVKSPREMDLRDIKNRQVRRNMSTTLFPSFESGDSISPVSRPADRKSSWALLGFLSCKASASVSVATSFSYFPKATTS